MKKLGAVLACLLLAAAVPFTFGNRIQADVVSVGVLDGGFIFAPQVAKAGAITNGAAASCPAGACVVSDGYNVASITATGTGRYTVELTAAMSSATAYNIQLTPGTADDMRWTITDADTFTVECDERVTNTASDCSFSFVVFDF